MKDKIFQMSNNDQYVGLIKFDPTTISHIPDNEVNCDLLKIWIQEVNRVWQFKKETKVLEQTIDKHLDLFLQNPDLLIQLIEIKLTAPRAYLVYNYLDKLSEKILEICVSHDPNLVSKIITEGKATKSIIEKVIEKEPGHLISDEKLKACKSIFNEYPKLLYKIIDKNVNFAKHFPLEILTNELILYSIKQSVEPYFFRNFKFLAHFDTKSEAITYLKKRQIILSDL